MSALFFQASPYTDSQYEFYTSTRNSNVIRKLDEVWNAVLTSRKNSYHLKPHFFASLNIRDKNSVQRETIVENFVKIHIISTNNSSMSAENISDNTRATKRLREYLTDDVASTAKKNEFK